MLWTDVVSQVTSSMDMEALHRYIMARHHVADYEHYMQLLAMYRNTSAIEAVNGRTRCESIHQAITQAQNIQQALIRRTLGLYDPHNHVDV